MSLDLRKPTLIESIALGGASCVFTVNFTHPIELVKTRMQVSGNALGATIGSTYAKEGLGAFWKGIAWAWGREGSYASIKLGAYAPVRDAIGAGNKDSPFYLKFAAGAITGGTGSLVGNPFDVLKTMAQTNSGKSESLGKTLSDFHAKNGFGGFYRGIQANIMRACVLNATKMGVYDIAKGFVTSSTGWERKDLRTTFCSAMVSGFAMTVTVSPFDRIRTALMNQGDQKLYSGFIDCATTLAKNDGPLSFWRGFIPMWARFAPTATIQLVTIEALYGMCGLKSI
mmetsp:Transcript_17648/g.40506  ORF Transcript_17648/g.40506 Transcript_17648/m.40506 type:complete len:284 (+) Transcript_17648:67-918(+)|eukprot:CAMPEP_0172393690 /NCGR_PEP_ID=MMETSP1061-20121228/11572_1 /TAXON_ID=37318 /ORGANISM="Pseudo-nitzschia pungens, Strain cf. pungens" /LENGTH=283 /DNA_ID=CAMNT_0013124849 /DNA_START=29 /DNA_END=880 /DNA_ORIENTATION=+